MDKYEVQNNHHNWAEDAEWYRTLTNNLAYFHKVKGKITKNKEMLECLSELQENLNIIDSSGYYDKNNLPQLQHILNMLYKCADHDMSYKLMLLRPASKLQVYLGNAGYTKSPMYYEKEHPDDSRFKKEYSEKIKEYVTQIYDSALTLSTELENKQTPKIELSNTEKTIAELKQEEHQGLLDKLDLVADVIIQDRQRRLWNV